ncbi:hypothetical protein ABMA27_007292 [Loxostege sticticalis]|uniref:N-acetylneuraminate lyase n=1 Tax=Loxostege sticticalis TaxID=481309 RepID=A0ABR3HEX1_LOXSC
MSFSLAGRKSLVDEWVKAGKANGLYVMVQVGGAPFADVVDLAQYCEKAGANSLLTLPELYFRPQSVPELVFYVEQVAKAAPSLPVLYYNYPKMSNVQLNMPKFVTAATERIPNFKGLKYSSNDLIEAAEILRTLKEDQEIFLGAASLLAPAALLGLKSSIATIVNLFPRQALDIFNAMGNNDLPKVRELQEQLSLAIEAHSSEGSWVPTMKAGMEIVTDIKVGPPALPQRPLSNEAKERIASKLKKLGLA